MLGCSVSAFSPPKKRPTPFVIGPSTPMSPTSTDPVSEKFARKLRFLLSNESVTIDSVARQVGFTPEQLQYVVDGASKPTRHLVDRLCEVFGVRPTFFGKDIDRALVSEPAGEIGGKPTGVTFKPDGGELIPKKRKFDLAELAAHHQALLECLFEKRILLPDDYEKKLVAVRTRAGLS